MRVQEALSCLQLPYVYVHVAMGSPKRAAFYDKFADQLSRARRGAGLIQVALLILMIEPLFYDDKRRLLHLCHSGRSYYGRTSDYRCRS